MNGHSRDDGFDELAEHEEFLPHKAGAKKETHFTDFEGKTSFGMSIFNLSNAIMGSGILGLAYAMSNTGIILFILLLICIAILSAYSIHLLLKSAGVVGIRAYEQLGNRAFGPPGKVLAAVIITIHNIGAMSSYLFIVKSELPLVIQAFLSKHENTGEWYLNGNYLIIIVSALIILPLALMRQLGYLGYTSGFSLSCMVFFLISVIYKRFNIACPFGDDHHNQTSFHDHVHINATDDQCEAKISVGDETSVSLCCLLDFKKMLCSLFLLTFSVFEINMSFFFLFFAQHYSSATKKRMQGVANISIMAMFVMYLLTALFGYLTFYGNVESELLHTYSRVDPLDVLVLCVRLAVLVAVTLTVPVVLFPVRPSITLILFADKPFSWAIHIGIAFCLLFLVNLLVILVPSIRDIFGLIGATSAPSLIFILPGIFYIRIVPEEQEPLLSRTKITAACFAALGFVFMVMSLSFIIIDWSTGESRSGGGH
uniref:Solute carrier family 38 member 5 n=1 Tax=Sparus aurata TaxID=8175 RepID=A0A671WMV2_SPAAU